jgi:hypothetical protein
MVPEKDTFCWLVDFGSVADNVETLLFIDKAPKLDKSRPGRFHLRPCSIDRRGMDGNSKFTTRIGNSGKLALLMDLVCRSGNFRHKALVPGYYVSRRKGE